MSKPRGRHEATVELTPLIDVVFLLLIFFMVSTTFIRETQLEVDLPEAAGELQEAEPQSIVVTIAADGTYAVKKEFHDISKKIARPVVNKVKKGGADHFVSDCPMAADQITQDLDDYDAGHPMSLLRKAYGI